MTRFVNVFSIKMQLSSILQVPCVEKSKEWCPIENETSYKLALTSFLTFGGDGWTFQKFIKNRQEGNQSVNVFALYIRNHSPITQKTEGRIRFTYDLKPQRINTGLLVLSINIVFVFTFLVLFKMCVRGTEPTQLEIPYSRFN